MIYFTSDLHFYHDNIIRHVNRPFYNVEEMNKRLIKNWNERISYNDEVYILGDITMKGPDLAIKIISQLRGKKYLVRGNHDKFCQHSEFNMELFGWIKDYAEIVYNNTKFILFHYPIMEWNNFFRGSIHLHGHQHNYIEYNYQNLTQGIRRYDVGVDANNMAPVSADEIIEFFSMMEQ